MGGEGGATVEMNEFLPMSESDATSDDETDEEMDIDDDETDEGGEIERKEKSSVADGDVEKDTQGEGMTTEVSQRFESLTFEFGPPAI